MPFVIVHMWEGRTLEQKRALAKAITDAMVEHANATPEALHVAIQEYPKQNWARSGVLGIDLPVNAGPVGTGQGTLHETPEVGP